MIQTTRHLLEVCVDSVAGAQTAEAGGADRLELNCALELGGLTPSLGLWRAVRDAVSLPIVVMVRPRPGGFCYDRTEQLVMLNDAERFSDEGADGIAFGALTKHRLIDADFCCRLQQCASGALDTVFHRAFDVVTDPVASARLLADLGITRILTSGQAATAMEGAAVIAQVQRAVQGAIQLLPGGGVRPHNVAQIIAATGCVQVHGSCRTTRHDEAGCVAESTYGRTDQQCVAAVRRELDQIDR